MVVSISLKIILNTTLNSHLKAPHQCTENVNAVTNNIDDTK